MASLFIWFLVESKSEIRFRMASFSPGVGGGGRDEVWDRATMFSQLAKRSPRLVVSGKLQYFSHSKYF